MSTEQQRNRVVITGWGAVTPVGLSVEQTFSALLAGTSGIGPITAFDASGLAVRIAGEVTGFDPDLYVPRSISRRMDIYAQYAVAAAVQATEQAKLDLDEHTAHRTGVLVGSGYGAVHSLYGAVDTLRDRGPRALSPFVPITTAMDSASGEISMMLGAKGPSRAVSTACATGTDAIGSAARWIRYGDADVVIAGGADDCITPVDLAASGNSRALSTRNDDPEAACRPFDADRDGFVMGAGAGVVVLEEANRAQQRGIPILAEVIGYGATSDAHHWTAPQPDGASARRAMRAAIDDARLDPAEVDHVNAHGTSTPLNDRIETEALRAVLGERATAIPVSSTKSMTGHMIGAAGAVEAIVAGCSLRSGVVPPTRNCHDPLDREMNYVPHTAQEADMRVAMSNSFGFGGHNAVLVLRRWP